MKSTLKICFNTEFYYAEEAELKKQTANIYNLLYMYISERGKQIKRGEQGRHAQ